MDTLEIRNEEIVNELLEIQRITDDCLDCILLKALKAYKEEL